MKKSRWCRVIVNIAAALMFVGLSAASVSASDGEYLWPYTLPDDWLVEGDLAGPVVVSDGNGGAIVVFTDVFNNGVPPNYSAAVGAIHVDQDGVVQWGRQASTRTIAYRNIAAIADGSGGVIVAWVENTTATVGGPVYVQRLNAAGVRQWGDTGVQVSNVYGAPSSQPPSLVTDYLGGAYVGWLGRLAYINAAGTLPAPGVDGIELIPNSASFLNRSYVMVSDGRGGLFPPTPGGVYAAWGNGAGEVRVQRLNPGLLWGAGGVLVAQHGYIDDAEGTIDVARDSSGGLLVGWIGTDISRTQARFQRYDRDGIALWSASGVVAVDSDVTGGRISSLDLASDDAGGLIAAWLDARNSSIDLDLFAQRVTSSGFVPWQANGILLPPYRVDGVAPGLQAAPVVLPDGYGGAMIAYGDHGFYSWEVTLNRIDAAGHILFGQHPFFDSYTPEDPGLNQWYPAMVFDVDGPNPKGAVVAWLEESNRIFAQKVAVDNAPPSNDNCVSASVITDINNNNGLTYGSLAHATDDGSSSSDGPTLQPDVWYAFTAPQDGLLTATTCGTHDRLGVDTSLDSILSLHSGCPGTISNELGSNDDWNAGECTSEDSGFARDSAVTVMVNAGNTTLVRVTEFADPPSGAYYSFLLNLSYEPDSDADGVPDAADNCINAPNGPLILDAGGNSQLDTDGDGYGNICDGDLNNSGGVVNFGDLAAFKTAFGTTNPDADFDGSGGVVNFGDLATFKQLFGSPPGPSCCAP